MSAWQPKKPLFVAPASCIIHDTATHRPTRQRPNHFAGGLGNKGGSPGREDTNRPALESEPFGDVTRDRILGHIGDA